MKTVLILKLNGKLIISKWKAGLNDNTDIPKISFYDFFVVFFSNE